MDRIASSSHDRTSLLNTHKMLHSTYFLLSLVLVFSTITTTASTVLILPSPGLILTLVGMCGLMFLAYKTVNKPTETTSAFVLTGFLGYILGPIPSTYLSAGIGDVIAMALGGAALVFFCCPAYALTIRKDVSFLGSMLVAGIMVVLIGMVANIFLQLLVLHLVISAVFILIPSGAVLSETSNIIHGGETNYIHATVSLYVSLCNIFVSLLSILGLTSCDQSHSLTLSQPRSMRGFVFCYTAANLIKVIAIILTFKGKEIETDTEGYLKEGSQQSEPLAVAIAGNEGISLSPEHQEVVRFMHDFYLEFNTPSAIRILVKTVANKFGGEESNSRYLHRLFPKGPAKQATKITGLPKPVKCV